MNCVQCNWMGGDSRLPDVGREEKVRQNTNTVEPVITHRVPWTSQATPEAQRRLTQLHEVYEQHVDHPTSRRRVDQLLDAITQPKPVVSLDRPRTVDTLRARRAWWLCHGRWAVCHIAHLWYKFPKALVSFSSCSSFPLYYTSLVRPSGLRPNCYGHGYSREISGRICERTNMSALFRRGTRRATLQYVL